MEEIEKYKKYIGKYIRNQYGIAKIVDVLENKVGVTLLLNNKIVFRVPRETGEIKDKYLYTMYHITEETHGLDERIKDITDLIEVGDVVHTKDVLSEDVYYMFNENVVEATKEAIQSGIQLVDILTHEQYEQNCYKLEE